MTEIIAVRFQTGGKQYYFDPRGTQVAPGQGVIVETSKGVEYGVCVTGNTQVEEEKVIQPLRPLVRLATERDLHTVAANRQKERRAARIFQEKVAAHKLEMKLVKVEYSFDGSKILFFFTADGRVDFRALVKDLAGVFHARIELRQIGVRDESRMLGGLGICGRPFCCAGFLEEFQPVSIKMAKTQSLSLNPAKISGTCGRLMCCLKYEQGAYEDAVKRCPKQDSFVETPDGVGDVTAVNLLREQVKVRLDDSQEPPQLYRADEVRVVRSGKGKRPEGYVPPSRGELARLRHIPAEGEERPRRLTEEDRLSAALEQILFTGEEEKDRRDRPAQEGRSRRRPRGKKEGAPQQKGNPPKGSAPKAQPPQKGKSQGSKPPRPARQRPPQEEWEAAPAQKEKIPQKKNPRPRYRGRPRKKGGGEGAGT